MVSHQPVKPARDEATGHIMIPLEKSSSTAQAAVEGGGAGKSFDVELVWVHTPPTTTTGGGVGVDVAQVGAVSTKYSRKSVPSVLISVPNIVTRLTKFTSCTGKRTAACSTYGHAR